MKKQLSNNGVHEQHAALGLKPNGMASMQPTHPDAQWFPKAGLGLMMHWGINSLHGKIDASWAMMANTTYDSAGAPANKLTPSEYWKLGERFCPDKYNPDKWLSAAAGFKYAVFVALHHDGYSLWPSKCSEFGVQSRPGFVRALRGGLPEERTQSRDIPLTARLVFRP